ncbi:MULTISPECIES: hypothetical protein [unclassified Methylobacterium]|jgi:hypothetical protein|uniref:hypothetical protein n=1 Tax=unclassified Methylobacterium TaxID=2615210 RepID=UPI001370AF97|nr:hypothetical protein [Methylobacterium sp. 2A]
MGWLDPIVARECGRKNRRSPDARRIGLRATSQQESGREDAIHRRTIGFRHPSLRRGLRRAQHRRRDAQEAARGTPGSSKTTRTPDERVLGA